MQTVHGIIVCKVLKKAQKSAKYNLRVPFFRRATHAVDFDAFHCNYEQKMLMTILQSCTVGYLHGTMLMAGPVGDTNTRFELNLPYYVGLGNVSK